MSIAVSAVVKPSTLLKAIAGCLCLNIVAVGCWIVHQHLRDANVFMQILVLSICIFFSISALYPIFCKQQFMRIDISGVGQIRITSQEHLKNRNKYAIAFRDADLMRLLPGSTIWSRMLVLRMENEIGKTKVLILLPDSLAEGSFRSLLVACRWIAAHNNPDKYEII